MKELRHTEETDRVLIISLLGQHRSGEVGANNQLLYFMDDIMNKEAELGVKMNAPDGTENILLFLIKELGVTEIPFTISGSPISYLLYWDTTTKSFIETSAETKTYVLKNITIPQPFFTLMNYLHPIQRKEFLNDLWAMILESKFKIIHSIKLIRKEYSSGFDFIIRGVLEKDYIEASNFSRQDMLIKITKRIEEIEAEQNEQNKN
jgi:hypothetical protein